MSALIDSISVQSEPLLTDTGHHLSIATTTTVEEQATVIRNYDARSSESVDKVETTDTVSKHPLTEEGVEQDNIAMATIIENKDTCDSVPSKPLTTKAVPKEDDFSPSSAKERAQGLKLKEAESDALCTVTVIENCDAGKISSEPDAYGSLREEAISESAERDLTVANEANTRKTMITATVAENSSPLPTVILCVEDTGAERDGEKGEEREERDSCDGGAGDKAADGTASTSTKTKEVSSPLPPTVSVEGTDKGIEEADKTTHRQLPKDILFFMRDQQSQTQLKQVPHDLTVI